MAFPTTPVLDTFTDASAPRSLPTYSANWSGPWLAADAVPVTAVDGTATGTGVTETSAYYPSISAADLEAYATIAVKPANGSFLEVISRIQTPGGATNAYVLICFPTAGTDTLELWEWDSGAWNGFKTVLFTGEINVGDQMGTSIIGNQQRVFLNGAQVGPTVVRSTISGVGTIGLRFGDQTGKLDSFGGGIPVPGTIKVPQYESRRFGAF